jgi:CubicO group peptidase (beta-lactamase class C family)
MEALPRTLVAIEKTLAKGAAGAIAMLALGTEEVVGVAAGRSAPRRPVTIDTLVPWSCAGKPLLAIALLPLIASGELPMDVPVRHWLPEFGLFHPNLTAQHLIMHEAGVNDAVSPAGSTRPLHEWRPEPGLVLGRDFIYSAWWNWWVLSAVLEAITGRRTESVVKDDVMTPAGMTGATFISPGYLGSPDRQAGPGIMEFAADASASDWLTLRRMGFGRRDPVTRICGPLSDLARFYQWVQQSLKSGSGPLPAALVRQATTDGLGFCVGLKELGFGRRCSPRSFGYGGALGGSNVVVGMAEPDHDFCLAVVVNRIGRESAFGLKAIVTAMYEDILDPGQPLALLRVWHQGNDHLRLPPQSGQGGHLGQVSEKMAEHYVHLAQSDLKDVLQQVWVAAVSRRPGVSRTFIYGNPDARAAVAAAIAQAGEHRTRILGARDDEREATWRERALNAEDALKAAHHEITVQRARIGELLGQVRDLQSEWTEEAVQRITTENTTLKQRVRTLTAGNRTLVADAHPAQPAGRAGEQHAGRRQLGDLPRLPVVGHAGADAQLRARAVIHQRPPARCHRQGGGKGQ